MKINTGSTVSLTTFRLRKEYKQELNETEIPSFVQERIDYFAEYLSKGMTFSDLYLFVAAESDEEGLTTMFEEIFANPYPRMSREFLKWYRDPKRWKQRQIDLANAVIRIYQQKINQRSKKWQDERLLVAKKI
ncbi:hypothetical protein [Enterococcus faecium]|uniref:hypothetical protein n=1 Tax=Enterococcus faecium TaxID=1352 RepID=UPI00191290C1|nr:hypothetical protein [Enterococcus faecium]MBK5028810.1 hypothetical protein [Enterococcus faecium]MBK5039477.1 hypothetical protein [Enterococcus faecium]MBK5044391.1 hypothetical protein [Enterococcus faecium]MBK5069393.1 hypothetical protein [Enterococcus faecium]MBK5132570.1 hypothetical protein [Enterococcus faecium]